MKKLFILSSLFALLINNLSSDYVEYRVSSGDTLYKIAKNNNISINKLLLANKKYGLDPNKIQAKDFILIPNYIDNVTNKLCSYYGPNSALIYSKTSSELLSDCINAIEKKIGVPDYKNFDDELKNKILSSNDFAYHLTNSFDLAYRLHGSNSDEFKLYLNILYSLAKEGHTHSLITLWYREFQINHLISDISSFLEIASETDEFLWLNYNSVDADFCSKYRDSSLENKSYFLKFDINILCADFEFYSGSPDWEYFSNAAINLIEVKASPVIYTDELALLMNLMIYYSSTNESSEAYSRWSKFALKFIKIKCPECNSIDDLLEKIHAYSEIKSNAISQATVYYLRYISSNLVQFKAEDGQIDKKSLGKQAVKLVSQLDGDISRLEKKYGLGSESVLGFIGTKRDIYLTLSSSASMLGECEYSDEMYQNSSDLESKFPAIKSLSNNKMDSYEQISVDVIKLDETIGSILYVPFCYLMSEKIEFTNKKEFIEKYIQLTDQIINDYENYAQKKSTVFLLNELIKAKFLSLNGSHDEAKAILTFFKKTEIEKKDFFFIRSIDIFKKLSLLYLDLFHFYDLNEDYADPLFFYNKKSSLFSLKYLQDISLDSSNLKLKQFQDKLKENRKKINELEISASIGNDEAYEKLSSLYAESSSIVKNILESSNKLSNYTNAGFKDIKGIQDSLSKKQAAVIYFQDLQSSKALVVTNQSYDVFDINGSIEINSLIELLRGSLQSYEDFNFQASQKLYKFIFKPFENFVYGLSEIMIYGDDFIQLPFQILIKDSKKEEENNFYKELISSNWLIKDYSFYRVLPIKSFNKNENYQESFLGYGNSSSYDWSGLPNLNEVNQEVIQLGISSNAKKNNLLLNKEATKENFINKLSKSYDRVVIATHGVSSDWISDINEPALIFNSNLGNYFLTPSEILEHNIETDMLLLSSCNTDVFEFDEITKAFLYSGAKSIIHSNWNLESKFASSFTTTFFNELWFDNKEKHVASRDVALSLMQDYSNQLYAHPSFWGNFTVIYSM